jgi:hypothetical protein
MTEDFAVTRVTVQVIAIRDDLLGSIGLSDT